jgi:hypothetical protein
MQRALTWSVSFVLLAWTVSAHAAPPSLNGNYAFTGTAACLFAPGSSSSPPNPTNPTQNIDAGFDAALQPKNADKSFSNSFAVEGIRTFNGDGTGTVKGLEVSITVPPTPKGPLFPAFPPSAAAAMFSYSFTYTFNPDGSFSSSISGSLAGTFTAGPRSGPPAQTFTVTNFPDFLGFSSVNSQTLTLANVPTPAVEIITFSNNEVWPRICHRSRVLIFLGGQ